MNSFSKKQIISTLIIKCIVIISVIVGVILSILAISSFMDGSTEFMYFTIQSNIAVAIVELIGLILILTKRKISYAWYVIKLVATVSITLTGTVFCFVLAPTMSYNAWTPNNIFTHVVVPIATIIDFFVICVNCKYRRIDVLYVVIPPLLYVVYAGIGYAANWKFSNNANYPYFFLNWGSKAGAFGFSSDLPFIGVVWWIILLLGLLIGVGNLYLFILSKLSKNND